MIRQICPETLCDQTNMPTHPTSPKSADIPQHTPWLGFAITRDTQTPVFEQICAAIRRWVISGKLVEGARLPPTRGFATDLGVSRSTVVVAYDQLVAEGYLCAVPGSGYSVCAVGEVERVARVSEAHTAHEGADSPQTSAPAYPPRQEAGQKSGSQLSPQAPLPFRAGQPDMRLFPHRSWAKTVARICRTDPHAMLTAGSGFGHTGLRHAIADHVAEWRGISADPEQIIVTAGATDALELCIRTLAKPGDAIGLENPCYQPLRRFARAHGLCSEPLDVLKGEASLPRGEARLVVLTPSQQYPLGGAMSPNRRLEFIRWAEARDGWIIEDDYDSEFRYAGRPIPAMAGFDHLNRTLYVGSFSKIFSNTLRMGYVIVPDRLRNRFRDTMHRFGPRASLMPQAPLAAFLSSGEFYRHLRRVRRIYGERRRFLLDHLSREFSHLGHFDDHQAGMQIAFHLTGSVPDTERVRQAADAGLTLSALSRYAEGDQVLNGFLLGFCASTQEEMTPALRRLKHLLDSPAPTQNR